MKQAAESALKTLQPELLETESSTHLLRHEVTVPFFVVFINS